MFASKLSAVAIEIAVAVALFVTAGAVYWSTRIIAVADQNESVPRSWESTLVDMPGLNFDGSYKVDPFIHGAIALQAMGKDKACKRLLELSNDPQRGDAVIVLCRMLFTRKLPGDFRRPMLGAPYFVGGTTGRDWPLEPIELVDGVPFLITKGYMLAGEAESGEGYLKYCMNERDWNHVAFKVPSPQAKQRALDTLLASSKLSARLGVEDRKFLAEQIKEANSIEMTGIPVGLRR